MICAGLRVTPDPVPVIKGSGVRVPVLVLGASREGSTCVKDVANDYVVNVRLPAMDVGCPNVVTPQQ